MFVVITKYDLVSEQSRYDCRSEDQMVTMETFEKIENELAEVFSIRGALEDNRIRWVSYTDSGSTDNPYIDNIALKFIRRMVMPGRPQVEEVRPVISPAVRLQLEANRWLEDIKLFHLFIFIVGVIVAVVMVKLFTAPL